MLAGLKISAVNAIYFVGAGLSKALQRDINTPIPLLTDFVKVGAHYAAIDESNVALLTLTGLVRLGRFRWKSEEALRLARAFDPNARDPQLVAKFVDVLRRRPAESVEDLLARENRGATLAEAAIFDAPIRFRYAISRIFSLIAWNVRLELLAAFLGERLAAGGSHTFISFNYDLFLDRAMSETLPDWSWHCGYGFDVPFAITSDPTDHGVEAEVPGRHSCQSTVRLLKPHGSLNWLLPADQRSAAMPFCDGPTTVRVDQAGRPEYVSTLEMWPRVVSPDEHWPGHDVGPGIIVPLRRKNATLAILKQVRQQEFNAVTQANEAFVLGWSMPSTDEDQRSLIRHACSLRGKPFERLVIVNLNQPAEYFEHVADTFLMEYSTAEIWNDGFQDYLARAG